MREMKDSGIEWIGDIPKSWKTIQIKNLFIILSGATPTPDTDNWDGDVLWITPADYKTKDKYVSEGKRNISQQGFNTCSTSIIPKGSIIFSKRAPIGTVAINTKALCTNQGCLSCISKSDTCNDYFYYVMSIGTEHFELLGSGTTFKEISANSFSNCKLPCPDKGEQERIAGFLDRKCVEIDSLVSDIQRQIELLEEYKRSVITEAVTKGLDKNAPMKDSGIEWIGDIPEHWEIKKIKYIGSVRNGLTYTPQDLCDNGTLVLRSSNVQNGKLSLEDNVYVSCNVKSELMIKKGDILICSRNGSKELIGKNAIITEDINAAFGAFMMILRCDSPKYLYYILNSNIFSYYLGTFFTSTINQLTGANFNNMKIVYCEDKAEQSQIISYLDEKCDEIDSIISEKKQQLEAIEEYKKSLIFEYVTGKREVTQI